MSLRRGPMSGMQAAPKESSARGMDPPSSPPSSLPTKRRNIKRKSPHPSRSADEDDGYEPDTPSKKVKPAPPKGKSGLRKQNKQPLKAIAMSSTYALSPAHDQMLVTARDAGKSWPEIRQQWEEMTGDKTAYSTLPNRYARLKSAFLHMPESDNPLLIEAKHEIDAEFEKEKWGKVAKRMGEKGSSRFYQGVDLKRQYERLMVFSEELRTGLKDENEVGDDGEEE